MTASIVLRKWQLAKCTLLPTIVHQVVLPLAELVPLYSHPTSLHLADIVDRFLQTLNVLSEVFDSFGHLLGHLNIIVADVVLVVGTLIDPFL